MPKTEAALPRSQYATDLEVVWGKNGRFALLEATFSDELPIDSLRDLSAELLSKETPPVFVLLNRMFRREGCLDWRIVV